MQWLVWTFVAVVVLETALRLWLASRQIASVRSRRDRVPEVFQGQIAIEDQRRAADYTVARAQLARWDTLLESLVKLAFTVGGGLGAVDALIGRLAWNEPWHGLMVVLTVFVILQVLALPFSLWRTFKIESRFGFNRMTPGMFGADLAKQLVLGLALGAPLLLAVLMLMDKAGAAWWLWAWAVWLIVSLTLTWAAPRFIAPLFNRFKAITDAALEERVAALLQRCGFTASGGVFVMDGSRRSSHGNAYFTGIGRNKRIVFFDTLLERIDIPEIEAVLAHELGHFRLHHVRQRMITSLLAALAGLALLGALARQPAFYAAFGVPPSASMALLLFAFVVPAFTYFVTPIEAWWSRRQELAADDFATRHCDPRNLASALIKLYRDNATTLTPDRVHSAFYDSHPSAVTRITRLNALAAS